MNRKFTSSSVSVLTVSWRERFRILWHGTVAVATLITASKFPGVVNLQAGVVERGQRQPPEAQ